ncbi:major capsid protein [Neptunomonas antarctica]|uniref:Bacteriophage coat protein B n=1 Tax=Neptunomonas antarctica TaxID=619304 RepID=A0A1N7J5K4_9GAMM|nr:major capsid protein [Neptunomonas antarctica]SIS44643.1 hypothetical protein SAMN05421760_101650 [Neptunomonas antarctica]
MSRKFMKKLAAGGVAVSGLVVMASANAALDAAVTTQIATTSADITEAGTLLIGLAVVAMGLRWVKATFF